MLGRGAAERATKLREVDLSRLKGFYLRFTPKMRRGVTCNWCLGLHLEVLELNCGKTPIDQNNRTCVRFSCVDRKSKFVYSVLKWLPRKILNENWPKLVWILNWSPERRYWVAKPVHFRQTFRAEIAQTETKPYFVRFQLAQSWTLSSSG